MAYVLHVLLLSVGSLVTSEVIYPGPGLTEVSWIVPNSLTPHCWKDNVIPYMFTEPDGFPISNEHFDIIRFSINTLNAWTCLKWVHVEETPVDSREYVVFNKTVDSWCRMNQLRNMSSGVKYVIITFNVACLSDKINHMMMHALGFLHEHQRSDRDCYVDVHPTQVNVTKYNIVPQPRWEERYPYDKYSALHYTNNYRLRSLIKTNIKKDYRQPLGNSLGQFTKTDLSKIRYKFCKGKHLCEIDNIICEQSENFKKKNNCTIWRFEGKGEILPPSPLSAP